MASRGPASSFSTKRIATPSKTGRGRKTKNDATASRSKKQMAVINWENVLVPMNWLGVYLGLGTSHATVETAAMRCQSSPELLHSMAVIEDRIMELLTKTMRLVDGPVFIVSEFTTLYVELVSSLFFPRLTGALRNATSGIYVVGTPNTQLNMKEMTLWKVNLLHTAIHEHLFTGMSIEAATTVLSRAASGRIKVVALCASDADVSAASGILLMAPNAVIKRFKAQGATTAFYRLSQAQVSLDEFYSQLQGMIQFVRQSTN
ncbi:Protein unc-50 [Phytophthora pseudosyringae]|uniref:Protein unc-50 n=1 Tax=Phytophthora pseudosyringae TaxID=221518 RepID=A0A8T1VWA4_9STRA|nr:Protein unc-50 [Phytophthora pseudosyringae]